MLIPIERGGRIPVPKQIVAYVRRAIEAGRLKPGAKLAPIRELAITLGVNRETVAAAYRELEILGLSESTVGRGTFVCASSVRAPGPLPAPAPPTESQRPFEPVFSRASAAASAPLPDYDAPAGAVHFERLVPDASLFPHDDFRKSLHRALASGGAALYDYGDPRGHEGLRAALVERLARAGIETSPDELLITSGSTQGLALAFRLFCDPGDAVVVESPTYPSAHTALATLGIRAIPVPLVEGGIDLASLEAVLARGDVRLVYTIPTFQNPTGGSSDLAHRRALLELCGRFGVPILEDDFEKDLRLHGRPTPSLRALDRRGLVVYSGTFSKVLFPGLRVGWLVAPRPIADAAVRLKRTLDLTSSPLIQAGLVRFLRDGAYDRHLRRALPELRRRSEVAHEALARHLPEGSRAQLTEGGYLVWVELPEALDSYALLAEAKQAGVVYAPGQIFYLDGRRSSALRIALSNSSVSEIERGIAILGAVARAALRGLRKKRVRSAQEKIHV